MDYHQTELKIKQHMELGDTNSSLAHRAAICDDLEEDHLYYAEIAYDEFTKESYLACIEALIEIEDLYQGGNLTGARKYDKTFKYYKKAHKLGTMEQKKRLIYKFNKNNWLSSHCQIYLEKEASDLIIKFKKRTNVLENDLHKNCIKSYNKQFANLLKNNIELYDELVTILGDDKIWLKLGTDGIVNIYLVIVVLYL